MGRPKNPFFSRTDPLYDCAFNHFEPFDCPPRPQWLLDIARKYDVELTPEGQPFQIGALMDCTETPGYTLSTAGSQTGKSRTYVIETIIMVTGKVPISMSFDKGVDTGHARKVTPENIARFGQLPDGSCGNIIGVGKYPIEKLTPKNGSMEIWIASYKEIKEKMWRKRLEELIPPGFLEDYRGNNGWREQKQKYSFVNGSVIRLITYEQKYKKTEGEWAHMIILDEEPPDRQYFISAIEHCTYLRLCFSPINGLGWSYYDCFLPATQDKKSPVKIFSCTQFDSPFQQRSKVEAKLLTYKEYEVKSRVFGQFSEICGKPYYNYEITQQFLKAYIPRHTLAKILPMTKPETAREAIDIKMRLEPAEAPGDDVWEIYEKVNEHDAYWLSADVAEGNENPDLAADASVAYIRRLPHADEKDPVMVAALQSRMRNVEFAWTCLWAAVYHNCALIAPETGVSADGAVFITTILSYPYLYRHTSTNDKTNRLQEKLGFDNKNATRKYAFDLVGTWLVEHLDNSRIYHYPLLRELSECITGKGGRPDHPQRGSTDCIMSFGISEYIRDLAKNQIRCNRQTPKDEPRETKGLFFPNILGLNRKPTETRRVLGSSRGLDSRYGLSKMAMHN
jgi:phage terminase large subunit-like protein